MITTFICLYHVFSIVIDPLFLETKAVQQRLASKRGSRAFDGQTKVCREEKGVRSIEFGGLLQGTEGDLVMDA